MARALLPGYESGGRALPGMFRQLWLLLQRSLFKTWHARDTLVVDLCIIIMMGIIMGGTQVGGGWEGGWEARWEGGGWGHHLQYQVLVLIIEIRSWEKSLEDLCLAARGVGRGGTLEWLA